MTDNGNDAEGRLAALGHSATVAGYARVFTIAASIAGPLLLGVAGWGLDRAYTAFEAQRTKFEEVRTEVAVIGNRVEASTAALTAAQVRMQRHEDQLLDHERRLSHIEPLILNLSSQRPIR